jgi:hypothetical protein
VSCSSSASTSVHDLSPPLFPAINAWDVLELRDASGGRYPYYFAADQEFMAATAHIGGQCFAKGAINYSLFGKAQHSWWKKFGDPKYDLSHTLGLINTYRTLYPDMRTSPPYLFTTPWWQPAYICQALLFGEVGWTGSYAQVANSNVGFNVKSQNPQPLQSPTTYHWHVGALPNW